MLSHVLSSLSYADSRRLMLALRTATELRLSAFSELLAPSVCNALRSWCVLRNLFADGFAVPSRFAGPRHHFCLATQTPDAWNGTWTHKWVCTCAGANNATGSPATTASRPHQVMHQVAGVDATWDARRGSEGTAATPKGGTGHGTGALPHKLQQLQSVRPK